MITLKISDATYNECVHFLINEAELLDEGRLREWSELLTEDIHYEIPVRITKDRKSGKGFSSNSWHMNENRATLMQRIRRLETNYAFAEDPPSRTRHFITNIRVTEGDDLNEVKVKSNLLLYRSRFDQYTHHLISAERHDVLRKIDGNWKLAKRIVFLDQTTLGTQNLAIFL